MSMHFMITSGSTGAFRSSRLRTERVVVSSLSVWARSNGASVTPPLLLRDAHDDDGDVVAGQALLEPEGEVHHRSGDLARARPTQPGQQRVERLVAELLAV